MQIQINVLQNHEMCNSYGSFATQQYDTWALDPLSDGESHCPMVMAESLLPGSLLLYKAR